MRDHGGNLDWAIHHYGGTDWIDLSTGINPVPYPVGDIPARSWEVLPTRSDMAGLSAAAQAAYRTGAQVVPLAGAQSAIQLVPYLREIGEARILEPTYNEHAAALRHAGWPVQEISDNGGGPAARLAQLEGADLAVVVNPNNPDGSRYRPKELLALADKVGLLVVDESFGDPEPELSIAPQVTEDTQNIVVMRSFGKFYGLAGVRLGFAVTGSEMAETLRGMAGPWPVPGPAIAIATRALADQAWHSETCIRLREDAARLDALAAQAGWRLVGGSPLFRTYSTPNAEEAQRHLAERQIWSRIFPWSPDWIRLGLPAGAAQWARLQETLAGEIAHGI